MDPQVPKPISKFVKGEKTLGYILLFVGIIIIVLATFTIYSILSGKTEPYKVFDVEGPKISIPSESPTGDSSESVGQSPGEITLLSDDAFSKMLNVGASYLALMFVASSGLKIASIGVKLIKDVKVIIKDGKAQV